MQKQLQRIRNNDYTHLDQKLYNNISITSQLDNTISQLAQLQKYLKSQIETIQDQGEKQAVLKASKVVMEMSIKAINKEREVDYSRVGQRCGCRCLAVFEELLERVRRVKKSFKITREAIFRQIKDCISDVVENFNENVGYLCGIVNRKTTENTKLKTQVYQMQQQISEVKQKNQQLNLKVDQLEKLIKQVKQKQISIKNQKSIISCYLNSQNHFNSIQSTQQYTEYINQKSCRGPRPQSYLLSDPTTPNTNSHPINFPGPTNQTPRLPMPLRRESSSKKHGNLIQRSGSHTNIWNQSQSQGQGHQGQVQSQKHKLLQECGVYFTAKNSPSKEALKTEGNIKNMVNKENQLLKLKGMDGVNRKGSNRKLKLFSIV